MVFVAVECIQGKKCCKNILYWHFLCHCLSENFHTLHDSNIYCALPISTGFNEFDLFSGLQNRKLYFHIFNASCRHLLSLFDYFSTFVAGILLEKFPAWLTEVIMEDIGRIAVMQAGCAVSLSFTFFRISHSHTKTQICLLSFKMMHGGDWQASKGDSSLTKMPQRIQG